MVPDPAPPVNASSSVVPEQRQQGAEVAVDVQETAVFMSAPTKYSEY
jgi:hypothetical protein